MHGHSRAALQLALESKHPFPISTRLQLLRTRCSKACNGLPLNLRPHCVLFHSAPWAQGALEEDARIGKAGSGRASRLDM